MKKLLFLFVSILFMTSVHAQIQWTKCLGGSFSDNIEDIHPTSDGGYVAAGTTSSHDGDVTANLNSYDAWVVKLSSTGVIEWQRCFGGSGPDDAHSVQQTSDGGFIFAGYTRSSDGDVTGKHGTDFSRDFWVVKISSVGVLVWQKCLGGSGDDEAYSVKETSDGGYIIAGSTTSYDGDVLARVHSGSDVWIVKLSNNGSIEWQNAFGGSRDDVESFVSICQTFEGGYVFATTSYSIDGDITAHHGSWQQPDFWVVKLSAVGNIGWQKSLGGTGDDYAYSIQQTIDTGYIVTGGAWSSNDDVTGNSYLGGETEGVWVVKLSSGGSIQWNKFMANYRDRDVGRSVQQTSDTGYIICGIYYNDNTNITSALLLKLSTTGENEWKAVFDGYSIDIANSVSQTNDEGYIICGSTASDDGSFLGNHGIDDGWVIKMGSKPSGVPEITNTSTISITPNPATNELSITSSEAITNIIITDLAGQTVYSHKYNSLKLYIDIANLTAGMYLIRINNTEVRKFVKQ